MKEGIREAMKTALREKDQVKLATIRTLLAAIQYQEIAKEEEGKKLADEEIVAIIRSEIKKRLEETEYAKQAKREDLQLKLKHEIATLESFLPKQLSEGELEAIVVKIKGETSGANIGSVMKLLKEQYAGQYDGKLASDVVRKVLG